MENNKNDKKLLKFLGKVAVGFIIGSTLTTGGAVLFGGYLYGSGKCLEYLGQNEEQKEVCNFIADCGKDIITGGLMSEVFNSSSTNSNSLVSRRTSIIGHLASKEIAKNGFTKNAKELISIGQRMSVIQKTSNIAKKCYNLYDFGKIGVNTLEHLNHIENGIIFKEDCELCKP